MILHHPSMREVLSRLELTFRPSFSVVLAVLDSTALAPVSPHLFFEKGPLRGRQHSCPADPPPSQPFPKK